jgi:hypothetical protein
MVSSQGEHSPARDFPTLFDPPTRFHAGSDDRRPSSPDLDGQLAISSQRESAVWPCVSSPSLPVHREALARTLASIQ